MVQVPVCETNRVSQAGFVATNIIGQNTPIIIGLDMEYFDIFWPLNASNMGGYEGIVQTVVMTLGIPPPPAPLTTNPAGFAGPGRLGRPGRRLRWGQCRDVTEPEHRQPSIRHRRGSAQTAAAPAQSMASMAPQMMSQLGQLPQMFGQIPQMLGQFPQMLGQLPQMAMGMLGPLTQRHERRAA